MNNRNKGREPIYDTALKIAVATEYLTGPLSSGKLAIKYGLSKADTVNHMVRWFRLHYSSASGLADPAAVEKDLQLDSDRGQDLNKQLKEANLKIAALQTMIAIASKELGVDIVKKHGAKQSGR